MSSVSVIEEFLPSWFDRLGAAVVKMGPIPKHIAIILDGNRRYAKEKKLENVTAGHLAGRGKMDEVVDMCLLLGVEELTMYVFSSENFKRSSQEVNGILELLQERYKVTPELEHGTWFKFGFHTNGETSNRKGICLEFVGNLVQNPMETLKDSIEKNMILSKDNQKIKVNIAFIYTGRSEICRGVTDFLHGVHQRKISIDNLSEPVIPEFFNLHSPRNPVDILIRTSGECRLSDFMIWQCDHAHMEFIDVTWPEFRFWDLLKAVFRYQIHVRRSSTLENGIKKFNECEKGFNEKVKEFINEQRAEKWVQINAEDLLQNGLDEI